MSASVPVLAYHSVGPGAKLGLLFPRHLDVLGRSRLESLMPEDLAAGREGFLLTFDDGYADLWTHGFPALEERGICATVFAIPGLTGDGPARPQGVVPEDDGATAGSCDVPGGYLRWSELRALEASGLVRVHSHSHTHAMAWVGDEVSGFNLGAHGKTHWALAQCTDGDDRLGIPLYRRGSALAHRRYFDDPLLRDRLAKWLAGRGGTQYIQTVGAKQVTAELRALLPDRPQGRWESEGARRERTLQQIVRARGVLEERLGGVRDELCLPWGEYDAMTLECARHAGVRRVYTLGRGANPAGRIGYLVNRFEPRGRGEFWLRSRLWVYRSVFRTRAYGLLSGRSRTGTGGGSR